ncbi:MAG: SpoIID/LytB domain-containing protein [Candidatus Melainabacteria bacterium]|nr:SpoIID/LytB domain-containing protein [Candidatus Melainabacteria bacterium]
MIAPVSASISAKFRVKVRAAITALMGKIFVILLSLLLLPGAALALPSSVKVNLFQAHSDINSLVVDGAFEISQAGQSGSASGAGSSTLRHAEISLSKNGLLLKTGPGRHAGAASASASTKSGRRVGTRIVIRAVGAQPLYLQPDTLVASRPGIASNLNSSAGSNSSSNSGRRYRGRIFVTASGGKLNVVNEVDTRSYITSVVGSESLPEFPLEALKAQSVLASTVLARQRPNMQLSDTTNVQAYLGSDYERPLVKQAVAAVFGQKLETSSGTTPAVFYHSTCAGGTSDEREVFSGKLLNDAAHKPVSRCRTATRVKCKYCQDSPFFKAHRVQVSADELRRKVGYVPLTIDVKDAEDRPLSLSVEKVNSAGVDSKILSISGYDLWLKLGQGLGWGAVPGMRYAIEPGPIVTITSAGAGHGAGLCQWGACGMAKAGKNYKEILHYYFPLAQVSAQTPAK